MSLSIPGSFPGASHPAASSGIDHATRNDSAGAAPLAMPDQNVPAEAKPPLARFNPPRDAAIHKKLLRAAEGNLAISLPAAVVGIGTSAATAAVRKGNVAGSASQAAIAGGLELAAGLGFSAMTTVLSHHTGLVSRIWPPSSEQEVLDRTFLVAAVMNAGHSILGGLGYDMAAKAIAHQAITHEVLLESVIDQVIGKFVAAGVIGVGARLMYKHNQHFRNMVNSTLISMLDEIKRRAGMQAHADAHPVTNSPEAAMEEGRLPAVPGAGAVPQG